MIIAQLDAGLGNQLFQYAAARRLALHHKTALKLDLSRFPPGSRRLYGLDRFRIAAEPANPRDLEAAGIMEPRQPWARFRARLWPYHHHRETHPNFEPAVMDLPRRSVLYGYFQSERFFAEVAPAIRVELAFRDPAGEVTEAMLARIGECRASVAVHVRRGDYVDLPEFGVTDPAYYRRAMDVLTARLGTAPAAFVFSDDPDWCRENLDLGVPFQTMRGDVLTPHDDLRLISAAAHTIIANSSFGWWGAWLNPNPGKIVIAPKRWFASWPEGGGADIVPAGWVRL